MLVQKWAQYFRQSDAPFRPLSSIKLERSSTGLRTNSLPLVGVALKAPEPTEGTDLGLQGLENFLQFFQRREVRDRIAKRSNLT